MSKSARQKRRTAKRAAARRSARVPAAAELAVAGDSTGRAASAVAAREHSASPTNGVTAAVPARAATVAAPPTPTRPDAPAPAAERAATRPRGWRLRTPTLRRPPGWTLDLGALGLIVLAAVVLNFEALVFGQVYAERDTYLFYYPVYQFYASQLQAGHIPLWFPQMFSGYPLLADGETGMYYPLHLLFFGLLPTPTAFVLLRVLHYVMAGAFMYAWMRALRLRRLGALLTAVTFAYGSFLVGQMHHENLLRTAVWLPLVLCWTELAYQRAGRARWLCLLAGGATLGVQLTALHVQPALMTLMALGLYVAFRTFWPPVAGGESGDTDPEAAARPLAPAEPAAPQGGFLRVALPPRPHWPAAATVRCLAGRVWLGVQALGTVVGLGIGLALAQLWPLYELGMQSFRGEGVPFAFATTYSLHPSQLATLLFPYFFRAPTGSWPLWAGWETILYVGVAPFVLALMALAVVRRREVIFFAALGLFGMFLAFGDYSPIPVLELLWPLPGFSALRVPGRYSFLLVVAIAALAGYGLDWLERVSRQPSRRHSLLSAVVGVNAAVAGLLVLFLVAHERLEATPDATKAWINGTYLSVRRMYRELNADTVYAGLLNSLDLGNRRTELAFCLLLVVAVLLSLTYLARRWAVAWRAGLVLLAAADLLLWGRSFHPRRALAELLQPPASVQYLQGRDDGLTRLWVSSDQLRALEYNRPTTWGITQAGGYSSLEPQRLAEYAAVVANTPSFLLDLWGVRWLAALPRPPSRPVYKSTAYYPHRALFDAGLGNPAGDERFALADVAVTDVRLVAMLSYAEDVPEGATVADIIVTGRDGRQVTLPLVAGRDVSEGAHDRGDVRPRVKHQRAEVAYSEGDRDINGGPYEIHYYFSQHALPDRWTVRDVEIRYRYGRGILRVFGLALYDATTGQAAQVEQLDRAKFQRVYTDADTTLYENTAVFPRAFVVYGGVLPRPELGGLYSMYLDPFDPTSEALLDDDPPPGTGLPVRRMGEGNPTPPPHATSTPDRGIAGSVRAATIERYTPERVVVQASAERPGLLVLTDLFHPGLHARVDGVDTPVLRADYFFRGVPLAAGQHEVELVFDPLSVRLGRIVSLVMLAGALVAAVALWRWPRRTVAA
ncbi:MAG TPA: hypothetical protein VFE37_12710 [Chloroflexota bacterium]|nr:hypothetical protein [Chloroflexota bacterium]